MSRSRVNYLSQSLTEHMLIWEFELKYLVAALTLGLIASPSMAQIDASLANDTRLVSSVTADDLEALAVSEGMEIISRNGPDEPIVVTARDPRTGLRFAMVGTACAESACTGINIVATWERNEENGDADTLMDLAQKRAAISIFRTPDSIGISRYVIVDGGQTMSNLKYNLRVFVAICDEFPDNFKAG